MDKQFKQLDESTVKNKQLKYKDKWLQSAKGMLKWLNIRLLPLQVMADQLKRTRLIT